ncbi:AI-2E family transporter [Gordonia sp. NPDC003429]
MARTKAADPRESTRPNAPDWSLPRGTVVLLSITGLVVTVLGIRSIGSLVGPVFLALMLTVAVAPVPSWLRRKGWPAWSALIVTILLVYGIIIGLFAALTYSVARLATILPQYSAKFNDLLDDFQKFLTSHGVSQQKVHDMIANVDSGKVISAVGNVVSSTMGVASALTLVLITLLFMAFDSVGSSERMEVLRRDRPDVAAAFTSFSTGTRSYLWVSTVFGLIVAAFDTGALALMGIPLPILWGLLSFITNYIPNIGFVIGVIPPALLGLLDGGWVLMVWVIVVYSVINFVIQSIIQPKFVGDSVGLSTTLTFLSLIFWAWVIGPLGAILAVPLTLFAKAMLIDIDPSARWADVLLTSKRPEKPSDLVDPSPMDEDAGNLDAAPDAGEDTNTAGPDTPGPDSGGTPTRG